MRQARWTRVAGAVSAVLALGACSQVPTPFSNTGDAERGGLAVAQGPQVASTGRAVLARRGSAADAAVAMSLAATVTMPARAGLGGGGVCIVAPAGDTDPRAITFPARAAEGTDAAAPALARGLARVHEVGGRAPWRSLTIPALRLAREGFQVSEVLNADLKAASERLDGTARAALLGRDGTIPPTGRERSRPALASTLAGMRERGPGYVYTEPFLPRLLNASAEAGYALAPDAVRRGRVAAADPLTVANALVPGAPATGGERAARARAAVRARRGSASGIDGSRLHLLLEALKHAAVNEIDGDDPLADSAVAALADRLTASRTTAPTTAEPAAAPGTGLIAVDGAGGVAACGLTMNELFGTGAMARGTGVLLAPAPAGAALRGVVPALRTNDAGQVTGAVVASDGAAAPSSMLQVLARLDAGASVVNALGAGRVAADPDGGGLVHGPALDDRLARALRSRGHTLREAAPQGTVQAVVCPGPARAGWRGCTGAADPRGGGISVRAD